MAYMKFDHTWQQVFNLRPFIQLSLHRCGWRLALGIGHTARMRIVGF